ncbi:UDP-2,3-diacylglucosamine diphosphatase LpxI [Psychromarinibacter sp. C21-152]|uniref:UDP-2,3-diacylglucosamine diphosphatase LpxI n=1 Tax=Psychromarinibacter sediminicola TaxID=3033385 RepID=A0AAE3NWK3_9RHOB|nr:UDP-2,3-diacylglucosamine diphosphatase LpxI [Psychromarinibacter sediminicola]MDF0602265.1 UDP-2,3-diacylglucosamine diphosphatase LpxI [Psychromarinibacter sediminicola]
MARLAVIAGGGALPARIAAAHPDALFVTFDPQAGNLPDGAEVLHASFERAGALFAGLKAAGVTEVVFAGGLTRPKLNPLRFDAKTMALAPAVMAALKAGDDGLLRTVVGAFETEGFAVRGAADLVPDLTAPAGRLAGRAPAKADLADIDRAVTILTTLGPLDIGQGAVVVQGLVMGIETVQGTDAMLDFVAGTRARFRRDGGVLVKAPKPGQDLRVDMPALGPQTVTAAAEAGLNGIAFAAGRVLLLDRDEMIVRAQAAGLFLLGQEV